MKAFSGFMALLALGMFANAIGNRWAFVPSQTGTKWDVLDIVIGLLFALISYVAYVSAERAEMARSLQDYERRASAMEQVAVTPASREFLDDNGRATNEELETES